MFGSKNDNARYEADLKALARRRDALTAGLDKATREVTSANDKRRALLIESEEAIGGPKLEKADQLCVSTENRRAAIEDALREVVDRIQATNELLEGRRDRAERNRLAKRTEQRADRVEAAARALDEALAPCAGKIEALRAVLAESGMPGLGAPQGDPVAILGTHPVQGLAHIVAAAVRGCKPPEGVLRDITTIYAAKAPQSAVEAAGRQISALRLWAAQIRDGSAPTDAPMPARRVSEPVPISEIAMVLKESVYYRDHRDIEIQLSEGACNLPAPVAEGLAKRGFAFPPGGPEAAEILAELQRAVVHNSVGKVGAKLAPRLSRTGPPFVDSGFSLREWHEQQTRLPEAAE